MHTYIHTYIHTYVHTYVCTYIHIHTGVLMCPLEVPLGIIKSTFLQIHGICLRLSIKCLWPQFKFFFVAAMGGKAASIREANMFTCIYTLL